MISRIFFFFQVEKKFGIHGPSGEVLYSAKEQSNCFCRVCCQTIRPLNINIRDQTGKDVISFIRPMNCAGMCCGIFYPHCTQALTVSINGETAGKLLKQNLKNDLLDNLLKIAVLGSKIQMSSSCLTKSKNVVRKASRIGPSATLA